MNLSALRLRHAAFLVAMAAGMALPRVAPADEAEERKANAQRLFVEGQAALDKGDKQAGCAKMRQSLGLFAVANTLFNVARCEEAEGQLLMAREHWQRGLTLLEAKDPRTPIVQKSIEALEARIPRVRVVMAPKASPLRVFVDGEEVPAHKLEAPLLVEPGKRVFLIRKEGFQDRRVELVLKEKERTEVVAAPGEPAAAPLPTGSSSVSAPVVPPPPGRGSRAGFVVLGVGALGILGAAATGIVVHVRDAKNREACDLERCVGKPNAVPLNQDGLVYANAALWGVGIAGAAAGAVMLILSQRGDKANVAITPQVMLGGGGVGISGRF